MKSPWLKGALSAALLLGAMYAEAQEDPTRGDIVMFPGPLRALVSVDSTDPQAGSPGSPAGWHIPGRHFRSGDGWWALVCAQQCELSAVRLATSAARHHVYDSDPVPSQFLRWSPLPAGLETVPAEGAKRPELIAVFKPVRNLASLQLVAGPLKTWLHAGMDKYPPSGRLGTMETAIAQPGGAPALVVPRLIKPKGDADPGEGGLQFELRIGDRRQILGSHLFGMEGQVSVLPKDYLRWAGDLDGDGKVDLLMSFSSTHQTLFLSSLAKPGELVGEAGSFLFDDPSAAGC